MFSFRFSLGFGGFGFRIIFGWTRTRNKIWIKWGICIVISHIIKTWIKYFIIWHLIFSFLSSNFWNFILWWRTDSVNWCGGIILIFKDRLVMWVCKSCIWIVQEIKWLIISVGFFVFGVGNMLSSYFFYFPYPLHNFLVFLVLFLSFCILTEWHLVCKS